VRLVVHKHGTKFVVPLFKYFIMASNGYVQINATSGKAFAAQCPILFDATVGATGADYTTLTEAIADSKVSILVINNTTEAANTALLANTLIYIKLGATVVMGANKFTSSGAVTLKIVGEGTLTYTHTSTDIELFAGAAGSVLIIDGISVTNSSTQAGCALSFLKEKLTNIVFTLPNNTGGGVFSTIGDSFYSNIHFIGTGTSTEDAFITDNNINCVVEDIIFTGTYIAGDKTGTNNIADFGDNTTINGVVVQTANNADVDIEVSGIVSNISANGGDVNIIVDANNTILSNLELLAGTIDVVGFDRIKLSNIQTTGLIDLTDANSNNCCLNNCRWSEASTIAGDRHKLTNCDILGGVSVSSGADDNGFVNCQIGPDAGGGALTLTVVAGSNRTRIVGCMSDSALSDSGTGTVTAGNTVY